MTLIKKQITLTTALFFALLLSAFGQPRIELNFQGRLTDAEGENIASESFDFTVKLISSDPAKTVLWSQTETISSDEEGWLSFSIPEISKYLILGEDDKNSVVIRLEFLPNNQTTWMSKGEDFMVTYTLSPTMKDDAIYLKMSRMEGSELTVHLEDHLYAFKDEYPFAYLTGGFLLSDDPPLSADSNDDLRKWILPDLTDDGTATRGVKGAFPKGGYRKR